jgi:hypothetical protein
MAIPPLEFPSSALIDRAVKEGIPRDWFCAIDLTGSGEETIVVIPPEVEGEESPTIVVYSEPGDAIAPAVIHALVQAKTQLLLPSIDKLVEMSRLCTATGVDLDSFVWQLYGDFVARLPGENDEDFVERVKCLIGEGQNTATEFSFLPSPTELGIEQFLACFGLTVDLLPTSSTGTIRDGFYWNRPDTGWNTVDAGASMAWGSDGSVAVIFIPTTGNTVQDEYILALVNEAKPFGLSVEVRIF